MFQLQPTHFGPGKNALNKKEFTDQTTLCDLNFGLYEIVKYRLIGMIGLQPSNVVEERDAILAVLDFNKNIE